MNVYINHKSRYKRTSKAISDFINNFSLSKPKTPVIIAGDFNASTNPLKHLISLTKTDLITYEKTIKNKRV